MKKILVFIIFIFFSIIVCFAQQSGAKKEIRVFNKTIQIHYKSDYSDDVSVVFSKYSSFFHQCGMPNLPVIRDYVIIPKKSHPNFKISATHRSPRIGVEINQSKPQTIDSDVVPDSICSLSYASQTQFLPTTNGLMTKILEFSGFDLLYFEVYPFQYNPAQKVLSMADDVLIEIDLSSAPKTQNFIEISPLEESFCKQAVNFLQWSKSFRTVVDSFPNYVIVTHSQFAQAADTLALWKAQQGYRPQIYISNSWTADSIRNLMISLYSNNTLRPSYLCLIGDTTFVPATERIAPPPIPEAFSTDLYFTTMDSDTDMTPNFGYGRIPVNSSLQALSVVKKLVKFQKFPPTLPSYYSTMVNCSFFQDDDLNGYDDRRFVQTSEEIRSYMQANYGKNVVRIYEAPTASNPQFWNNDQYANGSAIASDLQRPTFAWNGNTSDIINKINQGTFLLLHRDHGYSNASGWAHPQLASSQLQFLTNDSLLPLIFSINCYSGNFRVDDSFAERLLNQPAGASGIFAPSYYSYSGNNDAFALGLYDALFPSPGLIPQFTGTGGNHSPIIPAHISFDKPGDMLQYAIWYMNYAWGVDRYSSEIAHYFGDPAMPIFTHVPLQISALCADSVDCVDSVFTVIVPNSAGFIATLTIDQQVVAKSLFVNDTALIHFVPQYGNQALLTITGVGYAPYYKSVNWYCSQPIYPPMAGFTFSDTLTCNQEIQFTDTSSDFPTNWQWNFGDGYSSTLQNPTHHYFTSGSFSVSLKVENIIGSDSVMASHQIHVFVPTPITAFDTTLCYGAPVLFTNSTADSMAWYSAIGESATAWGNSYLLNAISDTTIYRATYRDLPELMVGKLDTTGAGGYIYQNIEHYLSFSTYADLILSSVDVYALSAGSKTIKLFNSENQLIASKTAALVVGKNTVLLDFFVPQGNRFRLVAPTYCSWFANINAPAYPYSIPGVISIDSSSNSSNYYFFYRWTFKQRCYSSIQPASVHLVNADSVLSVSGDQMLCAQEPIWVTADVTAHCVWNTGDTTASLSILQPGWYFSELIKQNCHYHTDTLHVLPSAPLVSNFSVDSETSPSCFHNLSQNAFHYFWDFGDGSYSPEINPCHTYLFLGSHEVTLSAINNCDSLTFSQTVVISHIDDFSESESSLELIPNPASSFVWLKVAGNQQLKSINMVDINGQMVMQLIDFPTKETPLNLEKLAQGIYFLNAVFDHYTQHLKLVKLLNR